VSYLADPRRVRRDTLVLTATMVCYPAYQGMANALVPLLMANLGLPKPIVGLVQALPGIMVLLLGAPVAMLANTRWRKLTIVMVFASSAVGCLLYARANSLTGLVIPQLIMGVGSSAYWANALASSFRLARGHEQNRIQAIITAAQGVGYFGGPVLGGYLTRYGYQYGFYVGAAFALLGLAASMWLSPSPAIEESRGFGRDVAGSYGRLVRVFSSRQAVLLGAAFVFLNCFLLYVMGGSFFLLYASQIGLSAYAAASVMAGRELVASMVRLSFGALSRRVRPLVLLGVGTALGSLALAFVPLASGAAGLVVIALILGGCLAFLPPAVNMLSGASAAPGEQSYAILSLNTSNFAAQTILAPTLGMALAQWGYGGTYPVVSLVWVALAVGVLIVGLRLARPPRPDASGQPRAAS
jgi:MFS family permease